MRINISFHSTLLSQEAQIHVGLPRPEQHLDRGIGNRLGTVLKVLGSSTALQLPVVLHQQMEEQDLGLIGCEEAARAGVDTVAENEVVRGCRHKLVSVLVARLLALL